MKRIGIDVGGTNTDAVLMDGSQVVASYKEPTTADVGSGIERALERLLEVAQVSAADIDGVMIGTTHFVNAVVERRHLQPTGVVRIALPATTGLPPFSGWPEDLVQNVRGSVSLVGGGFNYDGAQIAELDEAAIEETAARFQSLGIKSVAITSVFSSMDDTMETRAEKIFERLLPDVAVTLGSRVGRVGLLERENAAILNAALRAEAHLVMSAFRTSLERSGLTCPLFITQNDGTLLDSFTAEAMPVLTFASGPTNSMRGAALLTGLQDALVVDIGGTTADIGALVQGYPRPSSAEVDVAGVRTNFRMPDVYSVGIGGGSIARVEGESFVGIGPESVGFRLTTDALVFGGGTLTATDLAVACGAMNLGDSSRVAHLPPDLVADGVEEIHRLIEEGIDRVKLDSGSVPVVLVGGGATLVCRPLEGSSDIRIPEHAEVANAVGAALGQLGTEFDRVVDLRTTPRQDAIDGLLDEARDALQKAGADLKTSELVDLEEIPLSYMAGGQVSRLRGKVVAELTGHRSETNSQHLVPTESLGGQHHAGA